jgi:cysteinyl-tRNA synthetase
MNWFKRLFTAQQPSVDSRSAQVFLTNTLGDVKQLFISQKPGLVTMYSCGPTVYGPIHIGNLRAYVFPDTLTRVLEGAGYRVRRIINITDFGHLVSDGDEGEDKMTKGLKREGLPLTLQNMRSMSEKYASQFIEELGEININTEDITFPRASDYIAEQIALIQTLEQKSYAYRTKEGVYFDTARFAGYGKLTGLDVREQLVGDRVKENKEKRHPADFVLWKPDAKLGWESPWGLGFPGWHIECSAMSRSLLGQELDIHTGGEDLKAVHHNNEIAQSEAASGRTFVHYWMHNAFLTMSGEKASKSLGNVVYLSELKDKGYRPLALRYFFLQAHYRTPLSFSFDALAAAASALERLWRIAQDIAEEAKRVSAPSEARDRFLANMRDDLGTPQALGVLWDSIKNEEYTPEEKWGLIEAADAHLGLSLLSPPLPHVLAKENLPQNIQNLLGKREEARKSKDFKESDRLREELKNSGYAVEDRAEGQVVTKSPA